jgi:hypothetical protein
LGVLPRHHGREWHVVQHTLAAHHAPTPRSHEDGGTAESLPAGNFASVLSSEPITIDICSALGYSL